MFGVEISYSNRIYDLFFICRSKVIYADRVCARATVKKKSLKRGGCVRPSNYNVYIVLFFKRLPSPEKRISIVSKKINKIFYVTKNIALLHSHSRLLYVDVEFSMNVFLFDSFFKYRR